MTYTSDIPLTGESLGSTRDRIRTNFQQIAVVNAVNHVAFNSSGKGKHKFLQMPEQTSDAATAVNEGGLYVKVGTAPAESNLFFRGENNGGLYQLTRSDQTNFARFGKASSKLPNGWTFLPGGLLLQWGTVVGPGTSGTVTFATSNINFPTAIIQVQLTLQHVGSGAETYTVQGSPAPTTTSFQYRTSSSGGSSRLYWWALGY